MKNLHLLPTDKISKLVYNTNDDLTLTSIKMAQEFCNKKAHIYITSDEKIKNRDWCLYNKNHNSRNPDWILTKCGEIESEEMHPISEGKLLLWMKKIILTTDPDLIEDGVQAIDDEFLKWFVKNPNCDFVRTLKVPYFDESSHSYLLIIPKEEDFELVSIGEKTIELAIPMIQDKEEIKQETLEEAAKNYGKIRNELDYGQLYCNSVDSFKAGAKWQQEQNEKLK